MHGAQRVEMPSEKDKWIEFKNFRHQMKSSFVIYADFECFLSKSGTQPKNEDEELLEILEMLENGVKTRKVIQKILFI